MLIITSVQAGTCVTRVLTSIRPGIKLRIIIMLATGSVINIALLRAATVIISAVVVVLVAFVVRVIVVITAEIVVIIVSR